MAAQPSASMKEAMHLFMRMKSEEGDFSSQEQVSREERFQYELRPAEVGVESRNTNLRVQTVARVSLLICGILPGL